MNFTTKQLEPLDAAINWLHTDEKWEPGEFYLHFMEFGFSPTYLMNHSARYYDRKNADTEC